MEHFVSLRGEESLPAGKGSKGEFVHCSKNPRQGRATDKTEARHQLVKHPMPIVALGHSKVTYA